MELGIDVETLRKGDVISDATIRAIIGHEDDPIEFIKYRHFWAEALKAELRKSGKMFTVRWAGDELHILTDEAASRYNAKRFASGRRGLRRRNELLTAVDRSKLSQEQKALHDRELLKQAAVLSASDRAVRTLPKIATRRAVPAVRPAPRDRRVI